jgi:hypothetical protein
VLGRRSGVIDEDIDATTEGRGGLGRDLGRAAPGADVADHDGRPSTRA